ncbi:MAG: alpha amylase C-terminal domain-containing protein [Deferribacteraceae bacterium]|jgi:1,4-alpha-glucan branching enzyme|nr:alpha amylase C-terminal domain-containing protein [Deferribacteraceae bacterium]
MSSRRNLRQGVKFARSFKPPHEDKGESENLIPQSEPARTSRSKADDGGDTPLDITVFSGIHNDPRIDSPVVYGLGSYVRGYFPPDLDYIYFSLTYNGGGSVTVEEFYLKSEDGGIFWDLDLKDDKIRGYTLKAGHKLIIGFLRELLIRKIRWCYGVKDPFVFCAACNLRDGRTSFSNIFSIPLAYPANPLQDVELTKYRHFLDRRLAIYKKEEERILKEYGSFANYANLHKELGLHKTVDGWIMREWLPAATDAWLAVSDFNFKRDERFVFKRIGFSGYWELKLDKELLKHGSYIELRLSSLHSGEFKRIPAFSNWVEQDRFIEEQWCARVWDPPKKFKFRHPKPKREVFPCIYEAHVGIAQDYRSRTEKSVGSYKYFTDEILPYIKECGYTAVQLMAIPEHPLYKSFGYQVANFFAPSSRFGTPDEFAALVDRAHELGLAVILDITQSHSPSNTEQGLASYDTTPYFFADKDNQWGTRSFDYNNPMTRRFLLSNCRYWLEEYNLDGFRFDAVGNMIYVDHGFGDDFNDVGRCFYNEGGRIRTDEAGVLYLCLANALTKEIYKDSITIAEEFSGMPGISSPPGGGGLGFDYRFAMGIPDFWGKFIKEGRSVGTLWYEMINFRSYERSISYVASHDQSINGHDAMIWRLIGDEMYANMSVFTDSWKTSRGVALYKLIRLVTLSSALGGYMSFMGDEFGHPEWIDAAEYAHRQWHLPKRTDLKYHGLAQFDKDSLALAKGGDFLKRPELRYLDEEKRVLAFSRGDLLFAFNFHETEAARDLALWIPPGKYTELLSSDASIYAGHGNLEADGTEHFSAQEGEGVFQKITVYLPPLVALALKRS